MRVSTKIDTITETIKTGWFSSKTVTNLFLFITANFEQVELAAIDKLGLSDQVILEDYVTNDLGLSEELLRETGGVSLKWEVTIKDLIEQKPYRIYCKSHAQAQALSLRLESALKDFKPLLQIAERGPERSFEI